MLKLKKLKLDNLKLIAIDEADFFFERPEDRAQVKDFYEKFVKEDVQKLFFSATYSEEVSKFIKALVPAKTIKIELQKAKLNLDGIKQFYYVAKLEKGENEWSNPKIWSLVELLN